MRQNLIKNTQSLFLIIFILSISTPCCASMRLYTSSNCENCDLVMRAGMEAIEQLKREGKLEVIDVTDIRTDLPALPALIDNEKVIIGTGLLEYLDISRELNKTELDDCQDCKQ